MLSGLFASLPFPPELAAFVAVSAAIGVMLHDALKPKNSVNNSGGE